MTWPGERKFLECHADELKAWLERYDISLVWMHTALTLAGVLRRLSELDEAERLARVPLRVVMRG